MSAPSLGGQWPRVEELFYKALDLAPEDRPVFLENACAGNRALYDEVESLLACSNATLANFAEPVQFTAGRMVGQPQEGQRIGQYRLVRLLGRGGMGTVFLAERADDQYHQFVAIKLMNSTLGGSPAMLLRFRVERQILARLEHPNIARLLDGGITSEGLSYLAMEYVDGAPLDEYCRQAQPSLSARLQLFLQICDAVEYAHRYLVIHRDLKPANILVTPAGVPKLVDFGVARLLDSAGAGFPVAQTRTSERLFTPEYASPEQIRGEAITTATDVFGLGLLLYELLGGRRPFQVDTADPLALARAICEQEPKPPSTAQPEVPRDLDHVALMALSKEPARRYATVAQLSGDIRAFLSGLPVAARTGTFRYRSGKFVRRHKAAVTAAVLFLLSLAAFTGGMAILARRANRERAAAQREAEFLSEVFLASTPEEAAGRTVTARDLLDHGAERVDRDLASTPEVRAALLDKIGLAYRRLGVHDKALLFTQRALNLKKQLYGQQSPETAATLGVMAELYRDEGKPAQAEPLLRQVLAIRTQTLGENHELVAASSADLGECLFLEDKNTEAEALLRKSAAYYRGTGGADLAPVDNYLAQVLERSGSEAEAIQLLRESVDVARRSSGLTSRWYANCLHNLGGALMGIGDFVEAGTITREAAQIRQIVLPRDHPDRLYSLNNLTYLAVEEGNAAAAEIPLKEAMQIALKVYGQDHPRVVAIYRNQGRVNELKRDYFAAEVSYLHALDILQRLKQIRGSGAAGVLLSYAQMLLDRGDAVAAGDKAEQALAIYERVDGQMGSLVANSLIEAGLAREFSGDVASAEALFQRALEIRRKRAGADAPVTVAAQVRLGEALLAERKAKQAEPLLRDALAAVRRSANTLLPWQRAEAESALGACLLARGSRSEAEPLLRNAAVKHPRAWWNRVSAQRLYQLRASRGPTKAGARPDSERQ